MSLRLVYKYITDTSWLDNTRVAATDMGPTVHQSSSRVRSIHSCCILEGAARWKRLRGRGSTTEVLARDMSRAPAIAAGMADESRPRGVRYSLVRRVASVATGRVSDERSQTSVAVLVSPSRMSVELRTDPTGVAVKLPTRAIERSLMELVATWSARLQTEVVPQIGRAHV